MDNTFGRHRQSIADIENQLHDIFNQHPNTHINDNNDPVIPGDDLVDVLQAFSEAYNGLQLMNDEETAKLKELIQTNPGLEVTPSILIAFIAEKTKHSSPPPTNPEFDENDSGDNSYMQLDELRPPSRARSSSYHDNDDAGSSSDSNSSSYPGAWSNSQSDGPPRTPGSAIKSPFDHERRQRSTPLSAAPPSSWTKRPAPARRRKSMDAGSRSDSESFGPSSFSTSTSGRTSRQSSRTRSRAPSNPTSPVPSAPWSPNSSVGFPRPPSAASISRPGSRAGSRAGSRSGYRYDDPRYDDDEDHTIDASKSPFRNYDYNDDADDSFDGGNSISARGRMGRRRRRSSVNAENMGGSALLDGGHESPTSPDDDEDRDEDDDEDDSYLLHHQRDITTSDASMQSIDRVDALTRMNADLGRKLMEAERTLQHKLSEHELELEEMQSKLEEMRTELSATKREEKELRSKERQNNTQIAALEAEIAKVTKALESARSTYASLQRQYQEQCTVSERYRDELRQREELIRNLRDASALHDLEAAKWHKEQEVFESRISALEESLSIADAAHGQLEEQKQENLLLKETIDRMRFDMDELRNNAANNIATSGTGSAKGSMSKSLGAELAEKMKWENGKEEDGDEEDEVESQLGNLSMESTTVVDEEAEDTEGEEDVIQTIITRKKKKVASRANQSQLLTQTFEETKEYSDSSTQYDLTFFFKSHSSQTDPEPKIITASLSTQTEPPPETGVIAIQTEPETVPAPPTMSEMEIQTEPVEEEEQEETRGDSRSPSPQEQPESMASSSSTIIPPTPKAQPHQHLLEQPDAPPSYHQVSAQEQEERELRALAESLKKWHRGVNLKVPLEGVPGGIPEEAIEEWKALQSQLGVGCAVIDKIVENSQRVPRKHPKDTKGGWFPFINIHNKIYFGAAGASSNIAMWVGASALVLLAISPYMAPTQYSVPGGPTYYDRSAWSSFNSLHGSGEGFSSDGTAAVWSFLGRVGGGAARIARGWPT